MKPFQHNRLASITSVLSKIAAISSLSVLFTVLCLDFCSTLSRNLIFCHYFRHIPESYIAVHSTVDLYIQILVTFVTFSLHNTPYIDSCHSDIYVVLQLPSVEMLTPKYLFPSVFFILDDPKTESCPCPLSTTTHSILLTFTVIIGLSYLSQHVVDIHFI